MQKISHFQYLNMFTNKITDTLLYTLSAILICLQFYSCNAPLKRPHERFTIDSSIESEIENKLKPFNKQANSCIIFTIYEGEKILQSSSKAGDAGLSFSNFIENSVVINCLSGVDEGVGFDLLIHKDTLILQFKILSLIDKNAIGHGKLPEISANCTSKTVILSKSPTYKLKELIKGKIELETESFQIQVGDEIKNCHCKMKVYFIAEPLPMTEEKYQTLN